jgi:hypothetical protein
MKKLKQFKKQAQYSKHLQEDGGVAPTNSAGGGNVAGIGVGPQGEPGVDKKKKNNPIIDKMLRRLLPKNVK